MLPEIKVKIDADTTGLTRGLAAATDRLTKFGKVAGAAVGVAAVGAATGLAALTKRAIDNADALSKASQKMGMTVEALSRLQYAAKLSGVELNGLQTGMNALARNMAAGSEAFTQLGVAVTNSDGTFRSSRSVIGDIADRFANMEDGATKTSIALSIFGRAGADLIPLLNGGSAALAAMDREADNVGATISGTTARAAEKFNDTLTKIEARMIGVVNKIMEAVLPALTNLSNLIVDMDPKVVAIAAGLLGLGAAASLAAPGVAALAASFGLVSKSIAAIAAIPGGLALLAGGLFLGSTTEVNKSEKQFEIENNKILDAWEARKAAKEKLALLLADGEEPIDPYAGFQFGSDGKVKLAPPSGLGAGGGGGGGGGPTIDAERERIQARLDVIREGFLTENEMLTQKYADDQQLLDDALAKKLLTEKDHKAAVEALEKQHQDKLDAIRSAALYRNLDATASIFGSISSIMQTQGDKQIGIQKGIASAGVAISTAAGIMKAIEQFGWPAGLLPAAAVAAQGMAQLASINSASSSGSNSIGGVNGGGGAAAAQPTMNRTLTVQGITAGQIFTGDAMRDFMERMLDMQRDGYQVVLE